MHDGFDVSGQAARVETLLALVRDSLSSLQRVGGQLEREFCDLVNDPDGARRTVDELNALRVENAQLREALEGRPVIEWAKGMLMLIHHCDADDAFRRLVALSQRQQRKVRDVAAGIAEAAVHSGAANKATGQRSLAVVPAYLRQAATS